MFGRKKTSDERTVRRGTTYNHGVLIMGPPTFALLAMHRNGPAIGAIADSIPDSQYMPNISDVTAENIPLPEIPPNHYPEWSLRPYNYALSKSRPGQMTEELLARSQLAMARVKAIHRIMFEINRIRAKVDPGMTLQETIYMTKKLQAAEFARSGYDESLLIKLPYVLQYADLYDIPAREAADTILFRSSLDDALLSKSEMLRMKYFDLVKQTTRLEEFPELLRRFYYDSTSKQLV